MKRHPIYIKGLNNLKKEDKQIVSDLIRAATYRYSGYGYYGYSGYSDVLLNNPKGFSIYFDTSKIRNKIKKILLRFTTILFDIEIKGGSSKKNRNKKPSTS